MLFSPFSSHTGLVASNEVQRNLVIHRHCELALGLLECDLFHSVLNAKVLCIEYFGSVRESLHFMKVMQ